MTSLTRFPFSLQVILIRYCIFGLQIFLVLVSYFLYKVEPLPPMSFDDEFAIYSSIPNPYPPPTEKLLSYWPESMCQFVYRSVGKHYWRSLIAALFCGLLLQLLLLLLLLFIIYDVPESQSSVNQGLISRKWRGVMVAMSGKIEWVSAIERFVNHSG